MTGTMRDSTRPGYLFNAQGTQHVVFRGDSHIHELWWG
jgi:hypothetical protein